MSQTDAQGLLDYAQAVIEGEELMFIMDVPNVPVQEAPIVLAQAATPGAGATPQPDFILKDCQETEHTADPRSALRGVDPAGMLRNFISNQVNHGIDLAAIKNITLLEGAKHGKITTEVDNTGLTFYGYDPEPGYLGNDRAVFMAEFEGKRYKVIIDLHVLNMVRDFDLSTCPPPKLIKVNGKPVSGAASYDLNIIPVTFTDLSGAAVGQTVGSTITLDTNAAGYNWLGTIGGQTTFSTTSATLVFQSACRSKK